MNRLIIVSYKPDPDQKIRRPFRIEVRSKAYIEVHEFTEDEMRELVSQGLKFFELSRRQS